MGWFGVTITAARQGAVSYNVLQAGRAAGAEQGKHHPSWEGKLPVPYVLFPHFITQPCTRPAVLCTGHSNAFTCSSQQAASVPTFRTCLTPLLSPSTCQTRSQMQQPDKICWQIHGGEAKLSKRELIWVRTRHGKRHLDGASHHLSLETGDCSRSSIIC